MKRRQWIEIHEQQWVPQHIRNIFTEGLSFLNRVGGFYRKAADILNQWTDQLPDHNVLEMASGAADPSAEMLGHLQKQKKDLPKLYLTDWYPF